MSFWKKKDKIKNSNPFRMGHRGYSEVSTASASPSPPPPENDYAQTREMLLGDYQKPVRYDSQGHEDVYSKTKMTDGEDEVKAIKSKIRDLKQDTLKSSRNALQKINEAEEAAASTMSMLGSQSSQIANVGRQLDLSNAYSGKASAQASELRKLNRSIFIPVVKNPFNKMTKEQKEREKILAEEEALRNERNDVRQFEYDSSMRMEDAMRKASRMKSKEGFHQGRTNADRDKYQFEADEEDDAIEDEIDSNLDLLGDVACRLKAMSVSMSEELDSQNRQLDKLSRKVDPITDKLISTAYTLNKTR